MIGDSGRGRQGKLSFLAKKSDDVKKYGDVTTCNVLLLVKVDII